MGVPKMVNHTFRRALTVTMGGLLCGLLTAGVGMQPATAAPRLSGSVLTAAADDPDVDETVPEDDDVLEATPDWMELDVEPGYSTEGALSYVGESAYQSSVVGGATGGDVSTGVTPPADDGDITSPIDRDAMAKTLAAITEAKKLEASDVSTAMAAADPGKTKKLALKHFGQAKGYWCGPASGLMMLNFLKAGRSKETLAKLSQKQLANSSHMNTENLHGTPWDTKKFATGLNRWRGNRYYIQVNKPSAQVMRGALHMSVGSNIPIAADTVEFAGGAHYNNHPRNKKIGHWIVAYGYANNGKTVYFADPATTVWSSVSAKFSYSTNSFTSKFLQSNGIVY